MGATVPGVRPGTACKSGTGPWPPSSVRRARGHARTRSRTREALRGPKRGGPHPVRRRARPSGALPYGSQRHPSRFPTDRSVPSEALGHRPGRQDSNGAGARPPQVRDRHHRHVSAWRGSTGRGRASTPVPASRDKSMRRRLYDRDGVARSPASRSDACGVYARNERPGRPRALARRHACVPDDPAGQRPGSSTTAAQPSAFTTSISSWASSCSTTVSSCARTTETLTLS